MSLINDVKAWLHLDKKPYLRTVLGGFTGGPHLDAFGRFRVSQENNFFESTAVFDEQIHFWDKLEQNGATVTHVPADAALNLTVPATINARALRQTMNHFHYGAGQSLLVRMTGAIGNTPAGIQACLGLYDDDNGFLFRSNGGVFEIAQRNEITGIEDVVTRADFNIDTVDGSGSAKNPSGLNIDLANVQIFELDMEWLGSGRTRMGINHNGESLVLHEFTFSNLITKPYMRNPNLPLRYEVVNISGANTHTLRAICAKVANEGKRITGDLVRSIDNNSTSVSVGAANFIPVISLRLKPAYIKALINPTAFAAMSTSATPNAIWKVFIGHDEADLTGAAFVDVDGIAQKDVSATAINLANTESFQSFYMTKENREAGFAGSKFRLGSKIDGSAVIVTLAAKSISGTFSAFANIAYEEIF